MNKDQVLSHVRGFLKALAGALAAHGLTKVGSALVTEEAASLVMAIITFAWSHFTHSDSGSDSAPSSGASRTGGFILPKVTVALACVSIVWLGALVILPGCGTTQRAAFVTASTTQVTADAAMRAWGDYVQQFSISAADELKVKAAYEKYQAAMVLLIDAAQAAATLQSSGSTNGVADVANQAAAQAAAALADLVNLIRTLGVKL